MPQDSRVHGLDTLRAAAITLVFMYHYMVFVSGEDTFGFLSEIGWVGVDLFFGLSGYLIGNQIFAGLSIGREFSLGRFYARRLLRTLPNYYLVLALFYLCPGFRGSAELLPVWKFLTFTQNYELRPGTAFSHAWSLCIEEQFYLILPLLAVLVAKLKQPVVWAWSLIVLSVVVGMFTRAYLMIYFVGHRSESATDYMKYIYYSSFCRYDELVAGVSIALLKNCHTQTWNYITKFGNYILLTGVFFTSITFYLFLASQRSFPMTVFGYPILAISFSCLIISSLCDNSLLRNLRVPGAGKLALWSYAGYLTSKPICMLTMECLKNYGIGPNSVTGIAIMISTSLFTSWLLYTAIEAPFIKLRNHLVSSNFTVNAAIRSHR